MAMRLVQGGTLSSLLKTGALERRLAVEILRESAEALDHAHREGILHRDVKPQNILLDQDGHVYLADFGLAKLVERSIVLTKTGMISGTPQYMSPEQAQAEKVDHRTDIYALGVVAYEMLTGRVPFTADTPVAILLKLLSASIPVPSPSEVPEPLVRPVLKALAKNPDDRWPTATAFVRALEAGFAESATAAVPTERLEMASEPPTRPLAGASTPTPTPPRPAPASPIPSRTGAAASTPTVRPEHARTHPPTRYAEPARPKPVPATEPTAPGGAATAPIRRAGSVPMPLIATGVAALAIGTGLVLYQMLRLPAPAVPTPTPGLSQLPSAAPASPTALSPATDDLGFRCVRDASP